MAIGAAAFLLPQSQAGTFSADFNDNAVPPGTSVNGNTGDNGSGVIEDGVLKITKNVGGKSGGFVIDDLDAGAPVYGFTFSAKILVGGGTATPADGFSMNFAPDIDLFATPGEEGAGSGIRISFDTYDNGNENPPAPSIDFRIGNTLIATKKKTNTEMMTYLPGEAAKYADVNLTVSPDGALTLVYEGETIFDKIYFPGYEALMGGRFAIGGRTGGSTENVWLDDINFTTVTAPQVYIFSQPISLTVVTGGTAEFWADVNNAETATFQWLKNGQPIEGATEQTLIVANVAAADSGSKYSLRVTGPNNTVTTTEATLTVTDIPLPAPTVSYDFNTGETPAGTILTGTPPLFEGDPILAGYISANGGVNDSGALHLTDASNGLWGAFIIEDLNAGAPVYGITAHFKALVGGGTVPPADGFSFNFANDIPDLTESAEFENGIGTGLTVGFDIFDNAGGEGPSVDVRYGGVLVAQQKVPQEFLETGSEYADVIIRLENDGTIDVAYDSIVVFDNLLVPGFSSISGGRIALAARTGGLNANMWIDDLAITTTTAAGDLRITTQPSGKYVIPGQSVTLTSGVNDPAGVTLQWLRNGVEIAGANSAEYTFAATAADNNAQYTLRATRGALTATSDPATLTVLNITPTVSFDFNSGTTAPAGTTLAGNAPEGGAAAVIVENGGVDDSGVLHLTEAANSQWGAFVVEPLLGGAEVAAVNVAFDLLLRSPGTPADGISFNWAPNLPSTVAGFEAEEGTGQGLTVTFDTYDNGGGEAPAIDVKWKGVVIASTKLPRAEILTGDAFRKVIIKVTQDGKLDLVYGDRVIYSGLQITGYTPITNGKYAFYGRTGGANEDAFIDNVLIEAIKSTAPLRFVTEPLDQVVLDGTTATLNSVVSDPAGVTYQWYRNGVAINGATSASYTTPALALTDSGVKYKVTATGPGGSPTSREAVITVLAPISVAAPDLSLDFNDNALPDGMLLHVGNLGGGYIADGVLHLTDAANDQAGTLFIPAFDNGEPVSGFTATFKALVGGGTETPADGFSFVWANDISLTTPEGAPATYGEEGAGTGLTVSFDIYRNPGEAAPEFEIMWKGNRVAHLAVPLDWITTGDVFADVGVRLKADGTVDVQYQGRAIFTNVQLPNFAPIADAYFMLGGRTGGANANHWIDDIRIVTTTGVAAANVSIARNNDGTLTINWTGGGTLQSAPAVTGPWTDLQGVSTGATIQATGTMQFFRVAQ